MNVSSQNKKLLFLAVLALIAYGVLKLSNSAVEPQQVEQTDPYTNLFSNYDGSCKVVVEETLSRLTDPSSFKHIDTTYRENKDDTITVVMEFDCDNSLGGTERHTVASIVSKSGNIIEFGID